MLLTGFALVWLTLLAVYGIRVAFAGRFTHERAEKEPGSPFLGRFLIQFGYWAFSPLGKVCHKLGVTPNQLTAASLAASIAAAFFFALGKPDVAGALVILCAVFDALDGMVARARGTASDAGELIDDYTDIDFGHRWKHVLAFRWGADFAACLSAYMAATAYAKATDGVVFDPQEGEVLTPPKALEVVRSRGFATSHGEVFVGAVALAAPIFNHNGEVAGCLGVFGPRARVKDSDISRFGALVIQAANAISLQSGYRVGQDARGKPSKSRRERGVA